MVSGPGLWFDIGKRTKDLLYKDFLVDHKFSVTTTTSTGLTFISTGTKKGELFDGDVITQFKNPPVTVDVKVDTKSAIHTTVAIDEVMPGMKLILNATIPDQTAKLEVQHVSEYVGLTTAFDVSSSPIANCTAVLGHEGLLLGTEFSFDTSSASFTKYNGGIGLNKPDFSAALVLADMGDTIKASYSHLVNAHQRMSVGAEMSYKLSKNENTFTIAGTYGLDPLTNVKARVNNHGKVAATIQHEWRPKSLITLSGEVDANALDKGTKVGLSLALKP